MSINEHPRIEPITFEESYSSDVTDKITPVDVRKISYKQALYKLNDQLLDLGNANIEQMQKAYDYIRDEIVKKVNPKQCKKNNIAFWYKKSKDIRKLKNLGIIKCSYVNSAYIINLLKENILINPRIYEMYKKNTSVFEGKNKFIEFNNGFLIKFSHLERESEAIFLCGGFLSNIQLYNKDFCKREFSIDFGGNLKRINLTIAFGMINSYFLLLEEEFFLQPMAFPYCTTDCFLKDEFSYFHIGV